MPTPPSADRPALAPMPQAMQRLRQWWARCRPTLFGAAGQWLAGRLAATFGPQRQQPAAEPPALRNQARRDPLTGLADREALQHRLQALTGRSDATSGGLALLLLDLDRFKHVHTVLGRPAADQLLRGVAARLPSLVREGDLVTRLEGDRFALLLHEAGMAEAGAMARRLAECFEEPLALDGQAVTLTAGLGIALWPEHADDADELLRHAEVALGVAKRQAGSAQVYEPALDAASAQTRQQLAELRHALAHDELHLYLQPKIDIATGVVCGAEALLRWQHPGRGLVAPLEFLALAEQSGLIHELTLWVVEQAAAAQAALARANVRRVSVNLSARDLLDQALPDKLEAIVQRHHARPEGLCLEIPERALTGDPERAELMLGLLSGRGFQLSLDAFGSGYTSLPSLRRLPISELKIDRRLVLGMARSSGDATLVRSTIDLAHNLGLSVVAEGVESAAILSLLHDLQCDEGQGHHMSPPLPLAQFHEWAQRWQAVPPRVLAGTGLGDGALLH